MKNNNINVILFNKWIDYHYALNNNLLSYQQIVFALDSFLKTLINIPAESILCIQFKIKVGREWRSVSYLQTIKFSEFQELKEIFNEYLLIKDQDYILVNPSEIIFTYKLTNPNLEIKPKINRAKNINSLETINPFLWKGHSLPSTMDFTEWGKVLFMNESYAQVMKKNSNSVYEIEILDNHIKVVLKYKNKILIEFVDHQIEKGKLTSFERKIKNQTFYFIDEKCVFKTIKKETKFLKTIEKTPYINNNFITMDLETRTIDNVMLPYAVSIYDGKSAYSFYLLDYSNSDYMVKAAIEFLMRAKYNNYKVYLHNFSFFDSIFILKILSELTNITIRPIIRDGRIIDLKFSFRLFSNKEILNLYFRDSFLLLPSSLRKLAKNFKVENKGYFPYEFINDKNIPLTYRGEAPKIEYYPNISNIEYLEIQQSGIWDLRRETLLYCEQDVKTLHQIITKFQQKIFKLFRLDVLKYSTLSSLAFAIYRSNFMGDVKIPLIEGNVFKDIKQGYTGGSVDVYKPQGKNIYRYDVNSLYPFVMRNFPMPVGNPIYFEGDLQIMESYNLLNEAFGFFLDVEIIAHKKMNIPLLQKRLNERTVSPLGNWTGTYFSEELKNAKNKGYQYNIKKGYLFQKGFIFEEYVDFIYSLKVNSCSNSSDYIIAKLLLNSLYGRFGMNPHAENHVILDNNNTWFWKKDRTITNVVDLKNGKELISFFDDHNWDEQSKKTLNISVAISAAVTASARIHMSKFKTMEDNTLYYTDTDSIDVDKPLPEKFIGRDLGLMKLEHVFKEAIFLAPKVYGGITDSYEIVRVKGLKNPITYSDLEPLLYKKSKLEIPQKKWYKDIGNGHITVREEVYTLMVNNSKRILIYDNNNKFVNTEPLILKN